MQGLAVSTGHCPLGCAVLSDPTSLNPLSLHIAVHHSVELVGPVKAQIRASFERSGSRSRSKPRHGRHEQQQHVESGGGAEKGPGFGGGAWRQVRAHHGHASHTFGRVFADEPALTPRMLSTQQQQQQQQWQQQRGFVGGEYGMEDDPPEFRHGEYRLRVDDLDNEESRSRGGGGVGGLLGGGGVGSVPLQPPGLLPPGAAEQVPQPRTPEAVAATPDVLHTPPNWLAGQQQQVQQQWQQQQQDPHQQLQDPQHQQDPQDPYQQRQDPQDPHQQPVGSPEMLLHTPPAGAFVAMMPRPDSGADVLASMLSPTHDMGSGPTPTPLPPQSSPPQGGGGLQENGLDSQARLLPQLQPQLLPQLQPQPWANQVPAAPQLQPLQAHLAQAGPAWLPEPALFTPPQLQPQLQPQLIPQSYRHRRAAAAAATASGPAGLSFEEVRGAAPMCGSWPFTRDSCSCPSICDSCPSMCDSCPFTCQDRWVRVW